MSENLSSTGEKEEKNISTDVDELTGRYVPSSIEKKRAVMMYMLFGIMIAISSKKINDFEFFHLKQAIGRWICFILIIIITISLLLIPGIKYFGLIMLFTMVIFFAILLKQARDGNYYIDMKKYGFFAIFPSLGSRLVTLFEINPTEKNIGIDTGSNSQMISDDKQGITNENLSISNSEIKELEIKKQS